MIELVYAMKSDAADQERLIGIFSEMLDETVERNDCLQVFEFRNQRLRLIFVFMRAQLFTITHVLILMFLLQRRINLASFEGSKPSILASAYVRRMLRYSRLSPCCFVIALIYLERLKRKEASIFMTSTTFQRLLLVAVMVAAKFLDDYYESNKHW